MLNELWDNFLAINKLLIQQIDKHQAKIRATKQKALKQVLIKEMEKMPKSNLTIDFLIRMTAKERDEYMEKYFNMRYADYLI